MLARWSKAAFFQGEEKCEKVSQGPDQFSASCVIRDRGQGFLEFGD